MKTLFDTNVLIGSAFLRHPWNQQAAAQIEMVIAKQVVGYISTHSIAEFFSVATRYPGSPLPPIAAQAFLEDILSYLQVVDLSASDYRSVLVRVSALRLVSGAIFDALIAQAALKAQVDRLCTFNPKHFTRLGQDIEKIVFTPEVK